jgi:CheY-like chemotaxis protein
MWMFWLEKNTQVILVVEDNIEVLRLTSAMVTSLGYNVIEAMSGEMAIGILKIHDDIDLLLTDVILSGQMNGAELADEALRMRPNLKVLFNSGYAESAIFKAGFLAEGANILSKPFRKPQLAGKLKELLKK